MLLPALGEHVLLVRLQHGELADLLQVAGETAGTGDDRRKRSCGHLSISRGSLWLARLLLMPRSGAIRRHSGPAPFLRQGLLEQTAQHHARWRVPQVTVIHETVDQRLTMPLSVFRQPGSAVI